MTSGDVSITRFFYVLRAHAQLIIGTFSIAIVMSAVITFLTPDMYVSTTSLNFDFKSANPLDSRGRVLESNDYLYTQMDIIQSQNVAQKVVDSLTEYERKRLIAAVQAEKTLFDKAIDGIKDVMHFSSDSGGAGTKDHEHTPASEVLNVKSAYSWMARMANRKLSVEPRLKSRIVDISYSSTNPRIAALMANKFSEAYIATNLDMTINPARKTSLWFNEQLKTLREKLEGAQAVMTAYQQKEGIVSSGKRIDTESARLQALSSQLISAQQETRNAVFAQKKMQEILEKGVPLTSFSVVFNNPVVKNIKSGIRKLEGELVDMSASLGENHPRYKRLRAELSAARKKLQDEIKVITDGINNNAELAKAREEDLSAAVKEQKLLVLDLKREHDKIAVLKREVDSANKTYNAALTQLNTTDMQSMVDQTNVYIVDPANIPRQPASPLLMKNLALGAFGGLLFGIGIVVLLEVFARRIHSQEDLLLELQVPMLGHLKKA